MKFTRIFLRLKFVLSVSGQAISGSGVKVNLDVLGVEMRNMRLVWNALQLLKKSRVLIAGVLTSRHHIRVRVLDYKSAQSLASTENIPFIEVKQKLRSLKSGNNRLNPSLDFVNYSIPRTFDYSNTNRFAPLSESDGNIDMRSRTYANVVSRNSGRSRLSSSTDHYSHKKFTHPQRNMSSESANGFQQAPSFPPDHRDLLIAPNGRTGFKPSKTPSAPLYMEMDSNEDQLNNLHQYQEPSMIHTPVTLEASHNILDKFQKYLSEIADLGKLIAPLRNILANFSELRLDSSPPRHVDYSPHSSVFYRPIQSQK